MCGNESTQTDNTNISENDIRRLSQCSACSKYCSEIYNIETLSKSSYKSGDEESVNNSRKSSTISTSYNSS